MWCLKLPRGGSGSWTDTTHSSTEVGGSRPAVGQRYYLDSNREIDRYGIANEISEALRSIWMAQHR